LRELIEKACTPKQVEAVKYASVGYGPRRIARVLGISVTSVKDRLERAELNIRKAREAAQEGTV
jgi:DNA-directed RNA polymerase specialized sigma24 family protein